MTGLGYGRNHCPRTVRASAALLVFGAAGLAANAQPVAPKTARPGEAPRRIEVPTTINSIQTMHVGPRGVHRGPYQGGAGDACNFVSSYTPATSFQAGAQVSLQTGMIAGEGFAATYTVPAADFPIKINLTEVLFAAQSNVPTTTRWTITYWSGLPTTGTLVDTFSSDDVILPHMQIQACAPSTCGNILQFSVDPGDPEQIIINDNGSHMFTVAIRIDQFNTPSSCSQSPPASSNAFMCTDQGLSQAANNWLLAVNCGGFCAGGWSRFSSLPEFLCRPTGDWVSRTTWSSLACTPGVGACCLPAGSCQVLAVADCSTQGGQYLGDGVSCSGANCVAQTGACCLANGSCVAGQTTSQCSSQGGVFQGQGSVCGTCPQPTGACCFPGGCLSLTQTDCSAISNSSWLGGGVACGAGNTCPTGACCLPIGTCTSGVTVASCSSQGGTYQGNGSTCSGQCPQPTGACCLSNGNCLSLTSANCGLIQGASWAGPLTACATACAQPCYANCDASTGTPQLTANDFQCFLNKYAGNAAYANCDQSTGTPSLTANDFQCFLNKYAAGCT